jgi:hypothetical protein
VARRIHLKPAELRDGRYVKPFALLAVEQLWVGRREVWTATHGRASKYHVMVDGGVAGCRPNVNSWRSQGVILVGALIPIGAVPANMCCLRNGCRQIFEAFLS